MNFHEITVLAADDDADLQCVMQHYMEQQGCRFVRALTAAECMGKLETSRPHVVLLDLTLPDQDGLSLIPDIRRKSTAALIVITGKDEITDKIVGLEMGADDYLTKPFEMRELAARIKAVLRRTAKVEKPADNKTEFLLSKAEKISFNGLVLNRLQYQVFNSLGESTGLTSGEFKLLEALVCAPNRVLSREQLFEITREGNFDVYDRAIDIQVGRVRKKIGDDPRNPLLIKTIRSVGYIFCGDAKPVE
jgi:two-component system OmpR family response regulator